MILVTGASGLVGQHLLEALSHSPHKKPDQKIRALCRNLPSKIHTSIKDDDIEWVTCDITDIVTLEKVFQGITHVYHCAAMVSYDPRFKEAMLQTNIEGTANIVNLSLDAGIEKLVYMSSISVLGDAPEGKLITEQDDWEENAENSAYAISKQGAEMEVWRGIAEGLCAVIVNPGIILGEGDDSRSSTNLFKIVHGEFPYYTQGITSWVDVKDVVKAMIQLMKSDINQERFILSAGNYAFRQIFALMANAMHKKAPHKKASPFMTEIVWRLAYLKSMLTGSVASITKETARSAHKVRQFDGSGILKGLPGFEYQPIEETIKRIALKYHP